MQMLLMYFLCTSKNLVMNSTFNVYKIYIFLNVETMTSLIDSSPSKLKCQIYKSSHKLD